MRGGKLASHLEAIEARWRAGETCADIAAAFGVSAATISQRARALGWPRRCSAWTPERLAELAAHRANGLSFAEIAALMGASPVAVHQAARRAGLLVPQAKTAQAVASPRVAAPSPPPPRPWPEAASPAAAPPVLVAGRWAEHARAVLADGRRRTLHEICGRKHALCDREIARALAAMVEAREVERSEASGFCGPVIVYVRRDSAPKRTRAA